MRHRRGADDNRVRLHCIDQLPVRCERGTLGRFGDGRCRVLTDISHADKFFHMFDAVGKQLSFVIVEFNLDYFFYPVGTERDQVPSPTLKRPMLFLRKADDLAHVGYITALKAHYDADRGEWVFVGRLPGPPGSRRPPSRWCCSTTIPNN